MDCAKDVIKGLECCTEGFKCNECPYKKYQKDDWCKLRMEKDALELLKEQDQIIKSHKADLQETLDVLADYAEQQPKTGHWLKKMSSCPSAIAMGGSKISACDLCGGWGKKTFQYCPHCGAKMEKQP